jgi:hypothetical protein
MTNKNEVLSWYNAAAAAEFYELEKSSAGFAR